MKIRSVVSYTQDGGKVVVGGEEVIATAIAEWAGGKSGQLSLYMTDGRGEEKNVRLHLNAFQDGKAVVQAEDLVEE